MLKIISGLVSPLRGLVIVINLCISPGFAFGEDESLSQLLPVDCLLPAQVRQLGNMTYSAARRAVKVSADECRARGGEYVLYDRASLASTLKAWLPSAEAGDPEAQTYVGEAFERGYGDAPNFAQAAMWYLAAAEQGYARGALNLAHLFEAGLGLEQDASMAAYWFGQASELALKSRLESLGKREVPPPTIKVIEPMLNQRGIRVTSTTEPIHDGQTATLVVGQIEGGTEIREITLNGQPAVMLGGGLFRGSVEPVDGLIEVAVTEATRRVTMLQIGIQPGLLDEDFEGIQETVSKSRGSAVRRSVALVVGNNDYVHLSDLFTAGADARSLSELLQSEFGFEVETLLDASRDDLLRAVNRYRQSLNAEDRFLLYYAGHGDLDRVNFRGHWLPVDAEAGDNTEWISNVTVTDLLNLLPANEVLVISDSCYSGMLSRGALTASQLSQSYSGQGLTRVRTSMTSGGIAPVLDGIGGRHSIFADALIKKLEAAPGRISAQSLFDQIAPRVRKAGQSVGYDQQPEYAPLQFAGHEGGDFYFERVAK